MSVKNHRQFYEDPDLYKKLLNDNDSNEVEYYSDLVKDFKNVLYLGVGTGRLLKPLYQINQNITGIELSKEMARKCKKEILGIKIFNIDILNFQSKEKFDLILAPYEFLNHFEKKDLEKLIRILSDHLQINGKLVCQVRNPYNCINKEHSAVLDYIGLTSENVLEKNYISFDEINNKYVDYIERIDLKSNKHQLITMEWFFYFPDEFRDTFQKQNLLIFHLYGSFEKEAFKKDSNVLIIEASKN